MTELRMDLGVASAASSQLRQIADALHDVASRISASGWGLDWNGPASYQFHDALSGITGRLRQSAQEAESLGRRLAAEADEWEATAQSLAGAPLDFQARSSGISVSPMAFVFGIATGGGAAFSLSPYGNAIGRLQIWLQSLLEPVLERLGLVPRTAAIISPLAENYANETTARGGFEALLAPTLATGSAQAALQTASPSAASQPETRLTPAESLARNALPVRIKGQGDLAGYYGCAPTVMSMMMDFERERTPQAATASPTEIYRKAVELGQFDDDPAGGRGMTYLQAPKVFEAYGYEAEYRTIRASNDETAVDQLKALVRDHPVMAMIRLNYKTGDADYPHSVLVAGISDDGSMVRIVDPAANNWKGKVVDLSWAKFSASWASFADAYDNSVVVAKPKPSSN